MIRLRRVAVLAVAVLGTLAPAASAEPAVDPGPAGMAVVATVEVGGRPGQSVLDRVGGRLYVPDTESSTVTVVDTATNEVTGTLAGPRRADRVDKVVVDSVTGRLFVESQQNATLLAYDMATGRRVGTFDIGSGYHRLVPDEARSRLYVLDTRRNAVHVINTRSLRTVRTAPAPRHAESMVLDTFHGWLYIDGWVPGRDFMKVVDVRTWRTVGTIPGGYFGGGGMAIDPATDRLYASAVDDEDPGNVYVVDTAARRIIARVTVGMWPGQPVLDSTAGRVYLVTNNEPDIYAFDTTTATDVDADTIPTGGDTWSPAVDDTGHRLFAVSLTSTSAALAMVDTATDTLTGRLTLSSATGRPTLDPARSRAYVNGVGIITVVSLPG